MPHEIVATRNLSCGRLRELEAVGVHIVNHGGEGVRRPGAIVGVNGFDCCARCGCTIFTRFAEKNESTGVDTFESR